MQTLRRQGRAFALQLLYQADVDAAATPETRERFWSGGRASRKARAFATELVEATLANRERIDAALGAVLAEWRLGRLPVVVRNMLRLSACEMLVVGSEPHAALINEAVELTRAYMDEDSARFVNSVLDKLSRAGGAAPPEPVRTLG